MIRVMYRWTIEPGHEDEFIRNWDAGTRRIREKFPGSYGSMMLRSAKNRQHFYGVGRWESRAAWDAAQEGLIAMKLPGPMPESVRFFDEIDELTLASKPAKSPS
jgi:antibiotic biosynthesis monooxygenase (ABM) superfamily enzyme